MKLPRLPSSEKLLRIACVLALIALPLMVWSVFDPTVWPVLIALSVGQGIGTLSFALFLFVVARDLRLKAKLGGSTGSQEPPGSSAATGAPGPSGSSGGAAPASSGPPSAAPHQ